MRHGVIGGIAGTVVFLPQIESEREECKKLFEKVVALGGAISGEHGVGLAKTAFLRMQYGEAEIKAMLAIKRALDPKNILNPGKIFPAEE